MLYSSGIIKTIIENIPEDEYMEIVWGIKDSVEAIYKYQNSALGILDGIKNNYNETSFDVEKLQEALKEISDSSLVKEIMPLLGLE